MDDLAIRLGIEELIGDYIERIDDDRLEEWPNLFAAVGRYDQIVEAIAERFGGLTDALNARPNAAQPGHLPRDLIQDIRLIPNAFQGFRGAEA